MIKVLVDAGNASRKTGIGVYAYGLLHALQQYGGEEINAADSGVSMAASSFRPLWRLAYLVRLRALARDSYGHSDVVHFANIYAPPRVGTVAYVVSIHDIDPVDFPDTYPARYRAYFDRAVRKAGERASVILTDTEAIRGRLIERYKLPRDMVTAVGIGLNPAFVKAVDATPVAPPEEIPTLLFVGRLMRKKNIGWAFQNVVDGVRSGALPRMRIVAAGGHGDAVPEVQAAMRGGDGTAVWVGNPDIKQLAALYRSCAAVVLPSRAEGFGLPLIEAMYCGKPIVASRIPTSVEVAGRAADFFTLGNREEFFGAIRSALTHERAEERRRIAAERLEVYAWPALVQDYVQVYSTAIARARTAQ